MSLTTRIGHVGPRALVYPALRFLEQRIGFKTPPHQFFCAPPTNSRFLSRSSLTTIVLNLSYCIQAGEIPRERRARHPPGGRSVTAVIYRAAANTTAASCLMLSVNGIAAAATAAKARVQGQKKSCDLCVFRKRKCDGALPSCG